MKNTIKKLSVLLVFLFAILISSCESEKDFIEKSVDNKGIQLKKISFSELKSNPKAFQKLKEARLKKNPNFLYRGVYNEDYGVFIDTTNIIVIQKEDKHSITFQIVDEDFTNKVENLVLNSKEDGSYEAYITEYILSQEDFNIIAKGEILPAKEPSAITKIETLTRLNGIGGCFSFVTHVIRICKNNSGDFILDNGELGNGCVSDWMTNEYSVLTVDFSCLEFFSNAAGAGSSSSGSGSSSGSSGSGGSSGSSGSGGFAGTGTIGGIGGNSGSNNSSTPLMTTPLVNENKNEIKLLNGFNTHQTEWWFNATPETRKDVLDNVASNGSSNEAFEFAEELIDYLILNPSVTSEQIKNWFLTPREGVEDLSSSNLDELGLTFQQQNLPSFDDFLLAYPSHYDEEYSTSLKMYTTVGGNVLSKYNQGARNTCALRVSRAFNYAGISIPEINGVTIKGADNKNYFLVAKNLLSWMKSTFGTPTGDNLLNGAQGGVNGVNFPNLLNGKQGIYIMIPTDSSSNGFDASGHADIYFDNECDGGCYFSATGGINKIYFWELN